MDESTELVVKDRAEIAKFLRQQKRQLLANIKEYEEGGELRVDDARQAIHHSWSILARFEKEYETTDDVEELQKLIIELGELRDSAPVSVEKYISSLESSVEKLVSKLSRVNVLKEMQKSNRLLGQQMLEHQRIQESKSKQEYMEITKHAQILAAFRDIFYLALRRQGFTDSDMKGIAKEMKSIERDYPLYEINLQDIKQRLFGEPDEVASAYLPKAKVVDFEEYNELRDLE